MGVPRFQSILVPPQADATRDYSHTTHIPLVPLGRETCSLLSFSSRKRQKRRQGSNSLRISGKAKIGLLE